MNHTDRFQSRYFPSSVEADPNLEESIVEETMTSKFVTNLLTPKSSRRSSSLTSMNCAPSMPFIGDPNLEMTALESTILVVSPQFSKTVDEEACADDKLNIALEQNDELKRQLIEAQKMLQFGMSDPIREEIERIMGENYQLATDKDTLSIRCLELERKIEEHSKIMEEQLKKVEEQSQKVVENAQMSPNLPSSRTATPDPDMVQMCEKLLADNDELSVRLRTIEGEKTQLTEKVKSLNECKVHLAGQLNARENSFDTLKSFIDLESECEIVELRKTVAALEKNVDLASTEGINAKKELEEARKDQQNALSTTKEIATQLTECKSQLNREVDLLSGAMHKVETMENERNTAIRDAQDYQYMLEVEKKNGLKKLAELQATIANLETENQMAEASQQQQLQLKLEQTQFRCEQLEVENDQLKSVCEQLEEAAGEIDRLHRAVAQATVQLSESSEQMTTMKADKEIVDEKLHQSESERANLREKWTVFNAKNDQMINELKDQVENVKEQYNLVTIQLENALLKPETNDNDTQTVDTHLEMDAKNNEMTAKIDRLQKLLTDENAALKRVQDKLLETEATNDDLSTRLHLYEEEMVEIRCKLDEEMERANGFLGAIDEKSLEMQRNEDKNSTKIGQLEMNIADLEEKTRNMEVLLDEQVVRNQQHSADFAVCSQALDVARQQLASVTAENGDLSEKVTHLTGVRKRLETECDQADDMETELNERICQLTNKLDELKILTNTLEHSNEHLLETHSNHQTQWDSLFQEKEHFRLESVRLGMTVAGLERASRKSDAHNKDRMAELEKALTSKETSMGRLKTELRAANERRVNDEQLAVIKAAVSLRPSHLNRPESSTSLNSAGSSSASNLGIVDNFLLQEERFKSHQLLRKTHQLESRLIDKEQVIEKQRAQLEQQQEQHEQMDVSMKENNLPTPKSSNTSFRFLRTSSSKNQHPSRKCTPDNICKDDRAPQSPSCRQQ